MLHTDKMANSQRRYNNPEGACSHQQSFKIFQKLVELKEKNIEIHNYRRRL